MASGFLYYISLVGQLVIAFRCFHKMLTDLLHQFLHGFTNPFFVFLEGSFAAFRQIIHRDYPRKHSAYATQPSTMDMPIALNSFLMFHISFVLYSGVFYISLSTDLPAGSDRILDSASARDR